MSNNNNRPAPITWAHTKIMENALGVSHVGGTYLLGSSPSGQSMNARNGSSYALNPNRCILMRLLIEHPDYNPLPHAPRVEDVYEMICVSVPKLKKTTLTMMLGYSMSGRERIFESDSVKSGLHALLMIIQKEMNPKEKTRAQRLEFWKIFTDTVNVEAVSRGHKFDELLTIKSWGVRQP